MGREWHTVHSAQIGASGKLESKDIIVSCVTFDIVSHDILENGIPPLSRFLSTVPTHRFDPPFIPTTTTHTIKIPKIPKKPKIPKI